MAMSATSNLLEKLQISIKRSRKIRGANYIQLATADAEGRPSVRTVVFRGFLDLGAGQLAMKMITDARSEKVRHSKSSH